MKNQRKKRTTFSLAAVAVALAATVLVVIPNGGANAAPKDPVILVAGTFSPAFASEPLAARLRADGYRTYIYELPGGGMGDIGQTSQPLAQLVNQVLAQTGAQKVDLIGHSQGGLVARYYIKYLGGAAKVDSAISLGAPHYGSTLSALGAMMGGDCMGFVSCVQMGTGSAFLNDLNAGDDTIGNVQYTNFYTAYDELVWPVTNATMRDGATNVKIQSQCWLRVMGHLGLILDGTVYSGVQDALEHRPITLNCWAI